MNAKPEIEKLYYRGEQVGLKEIPKEGGNIFELTNKEGKVIYSANKRTFGRFLKKEAEHIRVIKKEEE